MLVREKYEEKLKSSVGLLTPQRQPLLIFWCVFLYNFLLWYVYSEVNIPALNFASHSFLCLLSIHEHSQHFPFKCFLGRSVSLSFVNWIGKDLSLRYPTACQQNWEDCCCEFVWVNPTSPFGVEADFSTSSVFKARSACIKSWQASVTKHFYTFPFLFQLNLSVA